MKKSNIRILTILGFVLLFGVDAFASSTSLTGTAGSYTISGTDTFGLGSSFAKFANFLSDNGLNKIIGTAGGVTAAILAYNTKYSSAIVTAVIATVGAFLPKAVDTFYGAVI